MPTGWFCTRFARYLTILAIWILFGLSGTDASAADDWVQEKRFNEQLEQALGGDRKAMYEIGRMFERGRGVSVNFDRALEWYHRAAKAGSTQAHARLGMLYSGDLIGQRDPARAYSHLSIASEANNASAHFYLAKLLEEGYQGKKDYARALELYKRAADGGFYQANKEITRVKQALETALNAARLDNENKGDSASTSSNTATASKTPVNRLSEMVLQGNWQQDGQPAEYLPSTETRCKPITEGQYRCQSRMLTSTTKHSRITYITMATLSGFSADGHFKVDYQNTILRVENETTEKPKTAPAASSEEDFSQVQQGLGHSQSSTQHLSRHSLSCLLNDKNRLTCLKDQVHSMIFSSKIDD